MCTAAAGGGHLGVLRWARANGCDWDIIILGHAMQQFVEATWRCCSGCVPMAATGVMTHAMQQFVEATWRCCSGPVITAALNDYNILILILEVRNGSYFLPPHAIDLCRRSFARIWSCGNDCAIVVVSGALRIILIRRVRREGFVDVPRSS